MTFYPQKAATEEKKLSSNREHSESDEDRRRGDKEATRADDPID